MTTKELEKKLKISENTCIHCPTLELAKQVLSIFHQLGLKWCYEEYYTLNHNWDNYKGNTVYYPFEGEFTSLNYAQLIDYEIISAEKFIDLHTEKEKFDLENYIPKGDLTGFPKEIIARMLDCQVEQGYPRDVSVFEEKIYAGMDQKGFGWKHTKDGLAFWEQVILQRDFNLFFEKYPKQEDNQDNSQEFKVGDKVIDIIYGEIGVIKYINLDAAYSIHVSFSDNTSDEYLINGACRLYYKTPQLLHYRDDYDYSVIDFNNLPKRQEYKESNKKEDNSQKFRVGDKVIDIILDLKGEIINVKSNGNLEIQFEGKCGLTEYNLKIEKRASLLHYRDDYDYDVIDFNNLPKRQEANRWRAEVGETYYCFSSNFKIEDYCEDNHFIDDEAYDSGNYFKTKEEAQEVADKLYKYFQEFLNTK